MRDSNTPALLADHSTPLAWVAGRGVSRAAFLADVRALGQRIPAGGAHFNLCENRYRFTVAFAAILLRGGTNILPPNRARQTLSEIAERHPGAHALVDEPDLPIRMPVIPVTEDGTRPARDSAIPAIPADQLAIHAYTSGSTGHPTAHSRRWDSLHIVTQQALQRFGLDADGGTLVGTVPAQHMYGLESTVLYALLGPCTLLADRPFFPDDIRRALVDHAPANLVTTPFHLDACLRAGLAWPRAARVLSATAPLERERAQSAETLFGTTVREIYGCTEAGAIASRETARESLWTVYDGIRLTTLDSDQVAVQGPQHPMPVPLPDRIELEDAQHFRMCGRLADQLNIAGKRASLTELNRRLNAIPGVRDGVFIPPDPERTGGTARLAAIVVAPERSEAEILTALAETTDPLFLPRPLIRVDTLPRSATGKVPRQVLLDLLDQHSQCA
ncbi:MULTISPECIES: AMP-binding protein [unclassified Thioalkalivibrio]|uniref:AMP-binding protein n=1 Tax=unclassified Thioalkalivibrio TaxID=2621013 RepID=UPI0003673704|nr:MULTISPECIES: AMP-binding protein [unclassified Thioalkalivibrio]